MTPVFTQPLSSSMSAYSVDYDKSANQQCQIHFESKQQCACASESDPTRHRACHQARARKFVLSVALLLLAVGATLVISCVAGDIDLLDVISLGADVSGGPLDKRSTSSSFTQNKLYLIIVFVGLFLVLIAGIMLSYWCCKGSFENPLCCPCYLCACCGGLACLECVGCGLCAAGLEAA